MNLRTPCHSETREQPGAGCAVGGNELSEIVILSGAKNPVVRQQNPAVCAHWIEPCRLRLGNFTSFRMTNRAEFISSEAKNPVVRERVPALRAHWILHSVQNDSNEV